MGKVNKKVNLGVLEVNPYVSKGVPKSCLDIQWTTWTMFTHYKVSFMAT